MTHVHDWEMSGGGMIVCRDHDDSFVVMGNDEVLRRLNATERLSPHLMGSLAYDRKLEKHWRQAFAEYAQAMYGDDYQMPDGFAAALEEQDD